MQITRVVLQIKSQYKYILDITVIFENSEFCSSLWGRRSKLRKQKVMIFFCSTSAWTELFKTSRNIKNGPRSSETRDQTQRGQGHIFCLKIQKGDPWGPIQPIFIENIQRSRSHFLLQKTKRRYQLWEPALYLKVINQTICSSLVFRAETQLRTLTALLPRHSVERP